MRVIGHFIYDEQKNHFFFRKSQPWPPTANASLPLGLGLDKKTNPRVRVTVQCKEWLGRARAEKERACATCSFELQVVKGCISGSGGQKRLGIEPNGPEEQKGTPRGRKSIRLPF